MSGGPRARLARVWAPLLAALFIAALYSIRLDSVFYFLFGAEGQGLLLAQALADGQGFVDLSLPGAPPHVREPPLFYLMLAGVIKLLGPGLYPMKVFMWLSYAASAGLATILVQRRTRPLLAFAAVVLAFSTPEFFKFFTGPKSDLPYTAISLAALIAIESLAEKIKAGRARGLVLPGAACALLIAAALFMRSLGVALAFALIAALLWKNFRPREIKRPLTVLILILAPVFIAFALWSARASAKSGAQNYNYLDWFLMDLQPDSPEMIAVDFHAPLMDRIPRGSPAALLSRAARHALIYPLHAARSILGTGAPRPGPGGFARTALPALLAALMIAGLIVSERKRPPAVAVYLAAYLGAVLVWPMDDPRLLMPLLPLAAFYLLAAIDGAVSFITGQTIGSDGKRASVFTAVALALVLSILHVRHDLGYHRAVSQLPATTLRPGFEVRFMSPEQRDSYQLLQWAGANTPPNAVIMYHSPPPCRHVSGRACTPIPFNPDPERVRQYLLNGPADYIVLDEFGRLFPSGPGLFVETMLRPAIAAHPEDFEIVHQPRPGSAALVVKPRKK